MGLANLVPGISGGTMLLAAGVYQAFIEAIAEVTTLKLRARPVVLLGTIDASARGPRACCTRGHHGREVSAGQAHAQTRPWMC